MRTAALLFIVLGGLAILLPLAVHVDGPLGVDCGAGLAAITRRSDAGDSAIVQDCRTRAFRRELFYGGAGALVLAAGIAMQLDITDRNRRSSALAARVDLLEGQVNWWRRNPPAPPAP